MVHRSWLTNRKVRASIEDEYARKLQALCRKSLGSCELGSLRTSLDVVRGETEAIAKAHSAIAGQMKNELEDPLAAFSSGIKERRKIIQQTVERLHKTKMQQTQLVNKVSNHPAPGKNNLLTLQTRDRYEQDCLRIKGYLAQGHMVMGQEERKNKAKLEKTQIQMASNSNEYEAAVKTLEETTGRWNKEWKSACDKFQDLEEERLDFTKSSLWTYANIASTVCVSDDAVCLLLLLAVYYTDIQHSLVRKFASHWRTVKWRRILCSSSRNKELDKRSPILHDSSTFAKTMTRALSWMKPTDTQLLNSSAL